MNQNEVPSPAPIRSDIVMVGVGRHGSSLVHGLSGLPASVQKLYVTASPTQALVDSPELIRVQGAANWQDEAKARLAGARMMVAVTSLTSRESTFASDMILLAQKQSALAVAVIVEPLISGAPHRNDAAAHALKEVVRAADATIVVPSEFQPAATLSISEAIANWNQRLADALRGLLGAAAADGAMNMDFGDLAGVLSAHSRATLGCGSGPTVEEALHSAARNSLAPSAEIETASSVLAHLTVGGEMPLDDARRAAPTLEQLFPKAEVFSGISVDPELREIRATLIAGKLDIEAARAAAHSRTPQMESPFFTVGDPTVYDGENLDIPAFIRKDVVLPGGPPRPVPAQRTLFEATPAASA